MSASIFGLDVDVAKPASSVTLTRSATSVAALPRSTSVTAAPSCPDSDSCLAQHLRPDTYPLRLVGDEVRQLGLVHRELLGAGHLVEDEAHLDGALRLLEELGVELLLRLLPASPVVSRAACRTCASWLSTELAGVAPSRSRRTSRAAGCPRCPRARRRRESRAWVACRSRLTRSSWPAGVGTQLDQGVELARQLREVVVQLRQFLDLDALHGHRDVGLLAGGRRRPRARW